MQILDAVQVASSNRIQLCSLYQLHVLADSSAFVDSKQYI